MLAVLLQFVRSIETIEHLIALPRQRHAFAGLQTLKFSTRTSRSSAAGIVRFVTNERTLTTFAFALALIFVSHDDPAARRINAIFVFARALSWLNALTLIIHQLSIGTETSVDTTRIGDTTGVIVTLETTLRTSRTAGHVNFAGIALHGTPIRRSPSDRRCSNERLTMTGVSSDDRANRFAIAAPIGTATKKN